MNKQEIISAINGLYDKSDLEKAKLDGYKEASDAAAIEMQELRDSLHVSIQEACSQCGYAPHTLKREVRSGAVALEMFSCSRCNTVAYPTVLAVLIMLDDEEVR